ncbi:MAG: hypothetical protein ABR608_13825, partial [Pseudonocardiaceae bacterium]
LGYFIVTDGRGTFARVGPQHWTRVDNAGQEIEGDLPDEIQARVPVSTGGTRVETFQPAPVRDPDAVAAAMERARTARLEAGFNDLGKANAALTSLAEAVEDLQAQFEQWLMETPPTEPGAIEAYRRCYEALQAIVGQL